MQFKIVFDGTHFTGTSGIETYTRNIARGVAALSLENSLTIYTTRGNKHDVIKFFHDLPNVDVRTDLPHPVALGKSLEPVVRKLRDRLWHDAAKKADVTMFPDPIHFAPRMPNAVVMLHDVIPLYPQGWAGSKHKKQFRAVLNTIVRDARKIIVPSQFVKNELIRVFDLSDDRVRVVQEAASDMFRIVEPDIEILRSAGVHEGERYFIHVGRLDPRKNLPLLVEAFAKLPPELRATTRLLIVGRGPDADVEKILRSANEGGVADRVTIFGKASDDDIVHLFNAAIAMVFPTLSEGFGLPAIEAMQCGCPVIGSNSSSIPEVIGNAGLLIDEHSPESIAAAMEKFVTDEALRQQCKTAGLERCKLFSWQRAARETMDVFEEVKNRRLF